MNLIPRVKTSINGRTVSYFELGLKSERIILILHGWGLAAELYLRLAELFVERKYHAIVVDLPGFGFSFSPKENWSYEVYADFVAAFIKQVINKPVTILGHSLGGGIGLALVSKYETLVEKLLLVDSAGIPINQPVTIIALRKAWEMISQALLPGGFIPCLHIIRIFFINAFCNPSGIYRTISLANKEDLSPKIKHIKKPTVILWAKKDMVESVEKGELLSSLLNAPLILAPNHLYHDWCITHPEVFITKSEAWL